MYKGIKTIKIKTIPVKSIDINDKLYKEKTEKGGKKIRNPIKYLMEKHGVSKYYAKVFLAQPSFIHKYWKEDSSGLYVDRDMLDSIGYGWKKERKIFMKSLKSTEKVREDARKSLKEDYGKLPSKKEMEERIEKMPQKYQKKLNKIQRVMKAIT